MNTITAVRFVTPAWFRARWLPGRTVRRVLNAALCLVALGSCAVAGEGGIPAPAGLVSWWRAEGNAIDSVGGNNGKLLNGTTFAPGKVGQAFAFHGENQVVQIPNAPSLNPTNALSLEAWVRLDHYSANDSSAIIAKEAYPFPQRQYQLALANFNEKWVFRASVTLSGGPIYLFGATAVQTNTWYHIAMTYDGAYLKLYLDGQLDAVVASPGPMTTSPADLLLGGDAAGPWDFAGLLDEVSLYDRALSASEIQSIYDAGSAGKHLPTQAPLIVEQPSSQSVTVGADAVFRVTAAGSPPLSYQWSLNGTDVANATNATLTLPNVQFTQAGTYTVRVTNPAGSTTSSGATLRVGLPAPAGLIGWWRAESNADDSVGGNNGTLHHVGFTNGVVGAAFAFDPENFTSGTYCGVDIPDRPAYALTNALSIEGWIRPRGNGFAVFWRGDNRLGLDPYVLSMNGNNHLRFYIQDEQGQSAYVDTPLVFNRWWYVAATFKEGDMRLYTNGVLAAQMNTTLRPFANLVAADSPGIGIGNVNDGFNNFPFVGDIDEMSLYNRALSAAEIKAIYEAGSAGKYSPANPPTIITQPASQVVSLGTDIILRVTATGSLPLSYQWSLNGTDVPNATNATLTLPNVQFAQAGTYAVRVTNAAGSTTSSGAVLTVQLPAPSGLIGWWRAEGNANDSAGNNNGTLINGTTFAPGKVGQAFAFDGTDQLVQIPNTPSLNPTNSLTLEGWVYVSAFSANDSVVIAGKDDPYDPLWAHRQYLLGLGVTNGDWVFRAHVGVPGGFKYFDGTTPLRVKTWYHVAMTYDNVSLRLYVNGQLDQSMAVSGPIVTSAYPFVIGGYPEGQPWGFDGRVDELSLYDRALSASEIQAIYEAGSAGKYLSSMPPSIVTGPTSQTVAPGSNVTLSVTATGTPPLRYQWSFDGGDLPGATNATLALLEVQSGQAGTYSVRVSNAVGSTTSQGAVLSVTSPTPIVQIVSVHATPGAQAKVPVALVSNGNVNSLSFSLTWNPSLLHFDHAGLADSASPGILIVNTNLISQGQLGVALAMAPTSTVPTGTQEVATVTFTTASQVQSFIAPLTFGDQPISRQLANAMGTPVTADFSAGTITVAPIAYEGDVWPRPNGDGAVTISDWILVGQFVARLDYPTNASEFQRADCAPRSSLGDGIIGVTDWVQAGRYVAGLDPLTVAGGPIDGFAVVPMAQRDATTSIIADPSGPNGRTVRIAEASWRPGQAGSVAVLLDALGNENALSFSLTFDPTQLSYLSATNGNDAVQAILNVNAKEAATGRLGFVLALPIGQTFPEGTREVLELSLQASPQASGLAPLTFGDSPVPRMLASPEAAALDAEYMSGGVDVSSTPTLHIGLSADRVVLSWPGWATNFVLQSSDSVPPLSWTNVVAEPVMTNSDQVLVLPVSSDTRFYQLQQR